MAISNNSHDSREHKSKKESKWSTLPGFRESWRGLLAIVVIALFCELPGLPWPVTVHKLLLYIDHVLPPIQGRGLFTDLLHFNYVVICLAVGIIIRNLIAVPKSWDNESLSPKNRASKAIVYIGSAFKEQMLLQGL